MHCIYFTYYLHNVVYIDVHYGFGDGVHTYMYAYNRMSQVYFMPCMYVTLALIHSASGQKQKSVNIKYSLQIDTTNIQTHILVMIPNIGFYKSMFVPNS